MDTVLVVAFLLLYLVGGARAIQWAARRSEQEAPKWFDAIGAMFWPALIARGVRWALPDHWNWPEAAIGAGLGAVCLFAMLRLSFKIHWMYATAVILLIYVSAVLVALRVIPLLSATPAAS